MEYSNKLGNFLLSMIYLFEGCLYLVCSFIKDGQERTTSIVLLGVWLLAQIILQVIVKKKNPKKIYIHRLLKSMLITVMGAASIFVIKDIYLILIFFLLEWLGSVICFNKKECRLLLFEQLVIIIGCIVYDAAVIGGATEVSRLLFILFTILLGAWIAKNNVENKAESINRGMVQRVSHENLIKVVEAKCIEARAATKSKSEFLANMSHEIRTPINAVLGLNEMIIRESKETDTLGYAHDIKSAGTTLLNIINDILDFSKIESGKMNLAPVNYDISALLNDVVNMINIKANDKGLSFKLVADASLPRILFGDEVRIKQVITNILTNAVKYTDAGSVELSVGYEKIEDFAIILKVAVKDTGKGMKQEDLEKLFSPFERIEETRNRHIEGTGLGMSITKSFLNMMGSELKVESVYGEGSVFSFEVRQEVDNWECMGRYEEAFKRLKKGNEQYRSSFTAPEAQILVVDDMPLNLTVFKGLLKETKVQIDAITSGEEALKACETKKYDVIFMDHMMPGMDGIETFTKLRESVNNPNRETPTVILTANAVSGSREQYMTRGFDDYLSKPIEPERLESLLIKLLPEKKVLIASENDKKEEAAVSEETTETDIVTKLQRIATLSVEDGMQNVGDEETYFMVVAEFARTCEKRCKMIEDYFDEGDIRNYAIQVHGLKSSARIIGDSGLSELARELEQAANEENYDLVTEKTPELIAKYETLGKALQKVFAKEDDSAEEKQDISSKDLEEAIEMIQSAIENFDIDSVEGIVADLENYRLPEEIAKKFEESKLYISEVDYEALGKLFGGN